MQRLNKSRVAMQKLKKIDKYISTCQWGFLIRAFIAREYDLIRNIPYNLEDLHSPENYSSADYPFSHFSDNEIDLILNLIFRGIKK